MCGCKTRSSAPPPPIDRRFPTATPVHAPNLTSPDLHIRRRRAHRESQPSRTGSRACAAAVRPPDRTGLQNFGTGSLPVASSIGQQPVTHRVQESQSELTVSSDGKCRLAGVFRFNCISRFFSKLESIVAVAEPSRCSLLPIFANRNIAHASTCSLASQSIGSRRLFVQPGSFVSGKLQPHSAAVQASSETSGRREAEVEVRERAEI